DYLAAQSIRSGANDSLSRQSSIAVSIVSGSRSDRDHGLESLPGCAPTRQTSRTWRMCSCREPFHKITSKLSAVPYDYGTSGFSYNTSVMRPEEAKEKGPISSATRKYAGKIGGYADITTRAWYAALQHSGGLGQGPR